jgi:hypothetical protein
MSNILPVRAAHATRAGHISVDPKIRLLAIYYNALDEGRKQQLLDCSHQLIEGQRAGERAGECAEQRADEDGMSMPA